MNSPPPSDLGRSGLVVGGKFRLDAMIGRGGMGSVWSATHATLGHRVAVKLVAREFVRSPEALRRFDAEAKAAARLASRHVVQVFDNGTLDDGTPYIAMEILSGENLEQRVERHGSLPLTDVVEILSQCCKGLARAHAAGIVHRDIKPDNIFLARAPDEDGDVVKILDFGVAKITLGEGSISQTGTGALLGTPLYMSPEQARGSKDVDHRTDLWSLAMVAYFALTGLLAIGGETFGDVLLKICVEPLPSLRAGAPLLPPSMERWFEQACAREPAERFQSAQEFIDSLRVAAGDAARPPRVTPPQVVMQPQPTMHSASAGRSSPGVSQSNANVAITAAGLPPKHRGVAIAGAALVGFLGLGAAALLALSPGHRESSSNGAPSARDPVGPPSASAPPPIVPSSPAALPEAGVAAAAAAPVTSTPSVPYRAPAAASARAPSAVAPPVVGTPVPPAPPAPTKPRINLGY